MNTLSRSCFPTKSKIPNPDVVAYFNRAVSQYKTYPSYQFLAAKGIVPSTKLTYTLAQIEDALVAATGHNATVSCDKNSALTEIWYYGLVQGSIQDGRWHRTEPVSCLLLGFLALTH